MANVFQTVVDRFKGFGELAEALGESARAKKQAEEVKRKLEERQKTPTQTLSGNIFKDVAQNLVPAPIQVEQKAQEQEPAILPKDFSAKNVFKDVAERVISGSPVTKLIAGVPLERVLRDPEKEVQIGTERAQRVRELQAQGKTREEAVRLARIVPTQTQQEELMNLALGTIGPAGEIRGAKVAKEGVKKLAKEEAIPRELEPLAAEARKYKSAEEFVRGQGKELYHGGSPFDSARVPEGGISLTESKTTAKSFSEGGMGGEFSGKGGVNELVLSPNAKILSTNKIPSRYIDSEGHMQDIPDLVKYAKEKGFDGVDLTRFGEGEIRVFNPDIIKTKSQLTDFYNKAVQGTTNEPLAAEARKYKSAEEFVKLADANVGEIVKDIDIAKIRQSDFYKSELANARKEISSGAYNRTSIEPIRLFFDPKKGDYEMVDGYHRLAKALSEGKTTIKSSIESTATKSQLTDFYNKAVGVTSQPPTLPKTEVVRGGTVARREPNKLPVEMLPPQVSEATNRSSRAFEKVYHESGGGARDSLAVETSLSPTIAGEAPQRVGLFNSFKEKAGNAWLATRELIEDEMVRVKKLVQDPSIKVTEESNPYQAEILFHGRVGARVENAKNLVKEIDQDIVQSSRRLGVSDTQFSNDVNRYLHARHAPERNVQVGTGASGMFTDDAVRIVKEIESSPHGAEVKRIADRLQKLNNETLDILLEGEVIDQRLYDTLRQTYKNHVPLNRIFEGTEDVGQALAGRPFDVRGTGVMRAKGSLREVADIQANIVANHEQALLRAEKNRVDLATLKFTRDNPQLGLFEEIQPKAIGKTFEGRIIKEHITDPQVLVLREAGKPVFLRIKDPNLAAALRGINRHKVDGILRVIQSVTRFYSGLATRFNPEFAFPNKIRDLQEALVYASSKSELGAKGAVKSVFRDPKSIKNVLDGIRGKSSEGANLYRQMVMDGGTTGGMGLSTRKQVELDLTSLRKLNRSKPRQAAQKVVEYVDAWNTVFEDSTRLSVYRTAIEQGATRSRAAVLAKEASVNFNKFGKGGPVINALYMFSNASIQGSAKMLRAMASPKVAGTVVTAVGVAVAAVNEWNDSVDPEWRDKVTTWDRLNSLPVMLPTSDGGVTYISIPVSWGLKPIKVAMDYAYDAIAGKGQGLGDAISGTVAAIIEGYNPVGGTDLLSAITPTIIDLPVEIGRNRAWHGGKIRPDWDANAPASIQYFPSLRDSFSGSTLVMASKGLSGIGIEVSPADLNYAYETIIGGAGRATTKVINTISAIGGAELETRDIPFVSRFLRTRTAEEVGSGSAEYEAVKEILGEQSRQRFYLNQQAEDSYQQLKNIPKEEAAKRFQQIIESDPDLARKINEIIVDEKLGLNYTDRLIKQLGVENGERAKYLAKKFGELSTKEEKARVWDEMVKKKIITKTVAAQLAQILK